MTAEQRSNCIRRRVLPLIGEVGEPMFHLVQDLIGEFLFAGSPDIALLINSPGGDVAEGLDIYDLIDLYPGNTTGIVIRQAASMAAVILQGCKKRVAAKHADILIHHISRNSVSLDAFEDETGKKLKEIHGKLKIRQKYLNDILTSKTKKSLEDIRAACLKNEPMSAEEAKAYGLIDEIAKPDDMKKWFAVPTS